MGLFGKTELEKEVEDLRKTLALTQGFVYALAVLVVRQLPQSEQSAVFQQLRADARRYAESIAADDEYL